MNAKKLIGMVIILAVLAAIAVLQRQSGRREPGTETKSSSTLLEGVDLNSVTQLEIAQGSNAVALVRKEGVWGVGSLFGYPVEFKKLAEALRRMAEIKVGQAVRAQNIESAEFGLDSTAKRIVLKAGDRTVSTVEVGARRAGSDSADLAQQCFIRKNDADAVYLVDYDFQPFSETDEDWIDRELMNVRFEDIVRVKSGNMELKLDGSDWTLADLNRDTEEFQRPEANKLLMALQYLTCTTVADPSRTDEELGFGNPAVYIAETTNKTYTVKIGGQTDGGGRYVRFEGDIDKKLSGWTYVIDSPKADDMCISRDSLVKKKEQTAAAEATADAGVQSE